MRVFGWIVSVAIFLVVAAALFATHHWTQAPYIELARFIAEIAFEITCVAAIVEFFRRSERMAGHYTFDDDVRDQIFDVDGGIVFQEIVGVLDGAFIRTESEDLLNVSVDQDFDPEDLNFESSLKLLERSLYRAKAMYSHLLDEPEYRNQRAAYIWFFSILIDAENLIASKHFREDDDPLAEAHFVERARQFIDSYRKFWIEEVAEVYGSEADEFDPKTLAKLDRIHSILGSSEDEFEALQKADI